MSKRQKALERILKSPPASDITWEELESALKGLGYKEIKGAGSRRKFVHPETKDLIICHKPHPSPHVGKGTVDDVADHLTRAGFNGG